MPIEEAAVAPNAKKQAEGINELTEAILPLVHEFVASADQRTLPSHTTNGDTLQNHSQPYTAFDHPEPDVIKERLGLVLPAKGGGDDAAVALVSRILRNSANTWHQGFLDKLYGSTDPVGVIAETILAVLNTNVHVYKVAPALTIIEKTVSRALAERFGFTGEHAGGVSQSGGSGANLTALVVARNCLFPETKTNGSGDRKLVLFTSAHGHYSFEKAAQVCGLGSNAVKSVPVDADGRMKAQDLQRMIRTARSRGETPFFVNATAGTTVLGSYDPFEAIAVICHLEGMWFHVDGSWGGSVIFSEVHGQKLRGVEKAHTLAVNPHKMLGTPITCSFLLVNDLRQLHRANTLPAAYLFHTPEGEAAADGSSATVPEVWDLADLTLQCGRRGDSLKLALAWVWYGSDGFAERIDHAFSVAQHLAAAVDECSALVLASKRPTPCLQVCFYFASNGLLGSKEENSAHTRRIANDLLKHEFLVDYAPGDHGLFFRVVVSLNTTFETANALVQKIVELGHGQVSDGAYSKHQ